MCGATKCGQGALDKDGCNYVYGEGSSQSDSKRPKNDSTSGARTTKEIECVCFYVPSAGLKDQRYDETQTPTNPLASDLFQECSQYPDRSPQVPQPSDRPWDVCDLPPHENLAIPYPRPSPSVELRGGQIYSGCQCVKRDGLQHDCPRTGCQGKAHCMAYPAPLCVPSGNAPPPPPSDESKQRKMWPRGGRHQEGRPQQRGAVAESYYAPSDDDPYVRLGRRGYRENPPVKQRTRVPCEEHRKTRC